MSQPQRKVYDIDFDESQAGIYAMSFVDFPAIEENFIHLGKIDLQKTNDERRMVYGPALIPGKLILRVDDKTQEEFYIRFNREAIDKLSKSFFKDNNHHNATVQHEQKIKGVAVTESWIKEGPMDKSIQLGLPELADGTWFIGTHVTDEPTWEMIKAGELMGYSVEAITAIVPVNMMRVDPLEDMISEIETALKNHVAS